MSTMRTARIIAHLTLISKRTVGGRVYSSTAIPMRAVNISPAHHKRQLYLTGNKILIRNGIDIRLKPPFRLRTISSKQAHITHAAVAQRWRDWSQLPFSVSARRFIEQRTLLLCSSETLTIFESASFFRAIARLTKTPACTMRRCLRLISK